MRHFLLAGAAALACALAACDGGNGDGNTQGNATAGASSAQGISALADADDLGTAARMLKQAGLEKTFEGRGSYTFFAPSDQAFAALPEDQRKLLESDEGRPQLIALLRQHISPGYLAKQDLTNALSGSAAQVDLASLGAAPIVVRKAGNGVVLGKDDTGPQLMGEPVPMGNSIAYRIDRFLPPPAQ